MLDWQLCQICYPLEIKLLLLLLLLSGSTMFANSDILLFGASVVNFKDEH